MGPEADRDTGEKLDIAWSEAAAAIPALLDEIQQNLYNRALQFRLANTHKAENLEEFKKLLEEKGGFIEVFFAGSKEDEKAIKEATGATPRCFPFAHSEERGKCFYTGKENARKAIFAKAY